MYSLDFLSYLNILKIGNNNRILNYLCFKFIVSELKLR